MARQCLVNGRYRTFKEDQNIVELQKKYPQHKIQACKKMPSMKTMEKYSNDGIAKATDGCKVEPDGECCHGHKSWLLVIGVI
jgi:hypothetical protein